MLRTLEVHGKLQAEVVISNSFKVNPIIPAKEVELSSMSQQNSSKQKYLKSNSTSSSICITKESMSRKNSDILIVANPMHKESIKGSSKPIVKLKPRVKSLWTKHMDKKSGRPYWYNTTTNETTWKDPQRSD